MLPPAAARSFQASAVALAGLSLCVMLLLPPFGDTTTAIVPLAVAVGLGIAVAFVLHAVFVGITAQRLGRRAWPWVVATVLTFPVGGIVALILFGWFAAEAGEQARRAG